MGALANSLELNYVFVSKAMKEFSFFEENAPVFFVLSQQLFSITTRSSLAGHFIATKTEPNEPLPISSLSVRSDQLKDGRSFYQKWSIFFSLDGGKFESHDLWGDSEFVCTTLGVPACDIFYLWPGSRLELSPGGVLPYMSYIGYVPHFRVWFSSRFSLK